MHGSVGVITAVVWTVLGLCACDTASSPDAGDSVAADTAVTTADSGATDATTTTDSAVTTETASDTAVTADSAAPVDTAEPAMQTLTVTIGPFSVPSGVERTMCNSVSLGNIDPGVIRGIRTNLTAGSHHLIVHRLEGAPEPTPEPCFAFEHGMGQATLFIAQQANSGLAYPPGTGLVVPAQQTLGLEMHYINYFSEDAVDIVGTVEIDIVADTGGYEPVKIDFVGPLAFSLPAKSDHTIEEYFPVSDGRRILAITSHTHELGRRATIHHARSRTDVIALVHESTSWSDPPLTVLEPPLVPALGEGLKLTCEFTNPHERTVSFGTSFYDEMCFMWLYYVD